MLGDRGIMKGTDLYLAKRGIDVLASSYFKELFHFVIVVILYIVFQMTLLLVHFI